MNTQAEQSSFDSLGADQQVLCAYTRLADIVELVEHPHNPNQHPQEQIKLLARIMKSNGIRMPIKVSTRSGYITGGHGRLAAAKLNGWTHMPIDEQDYDNEAQELADLVADNKVAELSHMPDDALRDIMLYAESTNLDLDPLSMGLSELETKSLVDEWSPLGGKTEKVESDGSSAPGKITIKCPPEDKETLLEEVKTFIERLGMQGIEVS